MDKIRVGDHVEICSNEDGFLGSYYVAKILCKVGKDKFKVEYLTLLNDEDEKKALMEIVEGYKVRPLPPEIKVLDFNVLDKVDAYDNDGWWVGRVTGKDGFGFKYFVYFDSSGDEFTYHGSRLRVHQEFEDGRWIVTSRRWI